MVRATSLLYAIYICLLVSILCAALLYYSSLYNLLNQFYNTREELFIQNQSSLTYYVKTGNNDAVLLDDLTGISSTYETIDYGLIKIGTVKSILFKDTVVSSYFIGNFDREKNALFLPNFSSPVSYSGNVTLIGHKKLPSKFISEKYINNQINYLRTEGSVEFSTEQLPEISKHLKDFATERKTSLVTLKDLERKNDSVYYNSFLSNTIHVAITANTLQDIVIKGNFILYAKDSLTINKSSLLEDVIIKAPKITIESNFKGAIQAIATEKIALQKNVELSYPSALVVYNATEKESKIVIDEGSSVYGAVILFGSSLINIDENMIVAKKHTLVVGDVYSTGKFMTQGKVYGSVYSNRIFSQSKSGVYENCLIDLVIDATKRPTYFVSIPIFNDKNNDDGVFKKVY